MNRLKREAAGRGLKKRKNFFQKGVDFSENAWYNNQALSDEAKLNN